MNDTNKGKRKEPLTIIIREINSEEKLSEAFELVWESYNEYKEECTTDSDMEEFKRYTHNNVKHMLKLITKGVLHMYGGYTRDGELLGMVSYRNLTLEEKMFYMTNSESRFVSLLFTKKGYYGKGIASTLLSSIIVKMGPRKLYVTATKNSQHIFENAGFKVRPGHRKKIGGLMTELLIKDVEQK